MDGIFGTADVTQGNWNEASKNLKAHCKVLNTALEGKTYLCKELSCADILLACTLMQAFQTVLDGGFRKAMKNVDAWASTIFALPCMQKVYGNV
jgi:glutathione S-transferase